MSGRRSGMGVTLDSKIVASGSGRARWRGMPYPPKVDAGKDRDWNGEKPTCGHPTPTANRPGRPAGIPAHLPATDKTVPPPDPLQKIPSGRSR